MGIVSEFISDISNALERVVFLRKMALDVLSLSMQIFASGVRRKLQAAPANFDVLHYRAGFGLSSLPAAKAKGALKLCDHSIVHPLVHDSLIQDKGLLKRSVRRDELNSLWKIVQQDIEQADHILVNSEFVKDTFVHLGFDPSKVSVIYLGVDDTFFNCIPKRLPKVDGSQIQFLFAGTFSERKGATTLLNAARQLPKSGWSLSIAGVIDPDLLPALQAAQTDMPIRHIGNLHRGALAKAMSETDVFVFPSLAEGSARVIFEALACGCYVITTHNAGSIVQDGTHGKLIAPGDSQGLAKAMLDAIKAPDLTAIGAANARLIAEFYRQKHYGNQLYELYSRLKDNRSA
jgi:glycosyltransferase involved in cell wall biosynthesis